MTRFSFARAWAVLAKEFTQMRRDRITFAMMLMIPVIQLLLFGYAINSDPRHLPTAVLVEDDGTFARDVLAAMKNSTYFDITGVARSSAELDRMMATGKAQFTVTIPADFTRRLVRHDDPQILVEADASDPVATGGAAAALALLPAAAVQHDLVGALAPVRSDTGPFQVVVHRRFNPEGLSSYNIVPGLLAIVLSLTLVMMTALGVTREIERGTMESLLATPVRPLEVMIGKLAPYVLVGVVQMAVILTMARGLFDVPMQGGWAALFFGAFLFIVGSLALGFFISTLADNQRQAMQISFFYMMPSILLSGFMFPFSGMPVWARLIGTAIPVTHFLRIVRGALLKGYGFAEMWPSLGALAIFVVVVSGLAVMRYRTTLD